MVTRPNPKATCCLRTPSGEIHHRCMNNIEIVNFVVDFAFVVTYIAIAVLPRAIRYFADRERNPRMQTLLVINLNHLLERIYATARLAELKDTVKRYPGIKEVREAYENSDAALFDPLFCGTVQ